MPEPLSRRLGSQLTRGTHKLASHAVAAAQAAGASFVAGLKTCDERGGASVVASALEIRVDDENDDHNIQAPRSRPIPSTGLASMATGKYTTSGNTEGFAVKLTLAETGPHAGCLVVRAMRSLENDSGDTVPIRCSWYRSLSPKSGVPPLDVPVTGVTGTVYALSADDVFASLRVEVRSTSPAFPGTAYAEIGPFEVDCATRKNLGNFIAAGKAMFPVQLKGSDGEIDHYLLHLSSTEVELRPDEGNYGSTFKCNYGGDIPIIKLDPHKTTGFRLTLREGTPFYLQAISRTQRDLIAMTFRCFHGLTSIKHSTLLKSVTHECLDSGSLPRIDLLLMTTGALSELRDAFAVAEKAIREKSRVVKEKDALEADIEATISSFQAALRSANPNETLQREASQTLAAEIAKRAAHVASLENELSETKVELKRRIRELETLRKDHGILANTIATLRDQRTMSMGPTTTMAATIQTLKEEISNLSSINQQLTTDLNENQTIHQSVPLETFTRAEKDMLTSTLDEDENEVILDLRKRLQEAIAEKDESTKNFLYIKAKYDNLKNVRQNETINTTFTTVPTVDSSLRLQALEKEKGILDRRFNETSEQLQETKKELYKLQTENAKLQTEKRKAAAMAEAAREQLGGQKTKLNHETAEGILSQTTSQLRGTEEIVRLSDRVQELEKEVETLTQQNSQLTKQVAELKSRLRKLSKEKD